MLPRPITITTIPNETSATAKRALFRIALCISMIGSVLVSTILFLQGGLDLGHFQYSIDIGQHSLYITSSLLIIFGLFSILTFILLTIGLIKMNRTFTLIATSLLVLCSFSLIIFSIWSFATLSNDKFKKSINNTLIKELDQTHFNITTGNNIIVYNTYKMARLERQHKCCGLVDSLDDYRTRYLLIFGSSSSNGGNTKGKITNQQRNPSTFGSLFLLPISCCNDKYRSNEHNSCPDIYGNTTNPIDRYNIEGCYNVITREKFQRIQQQGFITIIAACLAIISCIALAAVIKLVAKGYQVVPLRTTT